MTKAGARSPKINANRATAQTICMRSFLPGESMGEEVRSGDQRYGVTGVTGVTVTVSVKTSTTPWLSVTSREMV